MRKSSKKPVVTKKPSKAQEWKAALADYDHDRLWWFADPATAPQLELLKRRGWKLPRGSISKGMAFTVLQKPTPRMRMALESAHKYSPDLDFDTAYKLLAELAQNGWAA